MKGEGKEEEEEEGRGKGGRALPQIPLRELTVFVIPSS